MDLELTHSQQAFRDEVRDLSRHHVAPAIQVCTHGGPFHEPLLPLLSVRGLMGIAIPEAFGGRGLDTLSACLAIRELARVCPSTAVAVHVNNFVFCVPLLRFGSTAQKRDYLVPAASGQRLGAFALSEPDAGADPSRIRVLATAEDNGFRLSGRKAWVTNGGLASSYLVVARMEASETGLETAMFIVEEGSPGMTVGAVERTLGLHSARVTDVGFHQCRVEGSQHLSPESDGLGMALELLQASRIGVAAQSVGIARGAMDILSRQGGNSGRDAVPEAIRADIEAADLLMLRAAWLVDQGLSCPREASMAKLLCSETAVRAATACLAASGGEGLAEDHPSSRFWRDARVTTIYGGPSEIQRGLIARQLLHSSP